MDDMILVREMLGDIGSALRPTMVVGFVDDNPEKGPDRTRYFYQARYALLPAVTVRFSDTVQPSVVVMLAFDPTFPETFSREYGYTVVQRFGEQGVLLVKESER